MFFHLKERVPSIVFERPVQFNVSCCLKHNRFYASVLLQTPHGSFCPVPRA